MRRFFSGHHGRQRRYRGSRNPIQRGPMQRSVEPVSRQNDIQVQDHSSTEPSMANEETVKAVKIPHVVVQNCVGCGICLRGCPTGAISLVDGIAHIDSEKCVGCLTCMRMCPRDAIHL